MREDDASIPNHDRLFRRVPRGQIVYEKDGSVRLSSAVFKTPELSVNIESLMVEQGRSPEDTLKNYPGQFLTSILAQHVRERGHAIG